MRGAVVRRRRTKTKSLPLVGGNLNSSVNFLERAKLLICLRRQQKNAKDPDAQLLKKFIMIYQWMFFE